MSDKFKRLVILDNLILADHQWQALHEITEEVVEYGGLDLKQVTERLAKEHESDPGVVCFSALTAEQITEIELNKRLKDADAVISCWTNLPDDVIQENPQIRYVGFWTGLVQHRINLELAKKMEITVTYIPDYGTYAVAEFTFALLLEIMRKTAKQAKDTARGSWPYELLKASLYVPRIDAIPYRILHGKKLGIIGFGRIGQQVASIALGYGMDISYYSIHRKSEFEDRIKYKELDEILKNSDIVTVHLSPYAFIDPNGRVGIDDHAPDCPEGNPKSTDHPVIDRKRIALIKDGAIFINTSAGRLVDEEAILDEAESGRIRIALDVYRSLPNRKRLQKIIQLHGEGQNIFTYRGGWLTYESVLYKGDSLIEQAKSFLQNNK